MKRLELFRNRLYQKAKEDRERKFYSLHDKICRLDVLSEAWKRVAANHGSEGIDGQTIGNVEEYGTDRFLKELQEELRDETYCQCQMNFTQKCQSKNPQKRQLKFPHFLLRSGETKCLGMRGGI